jgi:hypothetical protein
MKLSRQGQENLACSGSGHMNGKIGLNQVNANDRKVTQTQKVHLNRLKPFY